MCVCACVWDRESERSSAQSAAFTWAAHVTAQVSGHKKAHSAHARAKLKTHACIVNKHTQTYTLNPRMHKGGL